MLRPEGRSGLGASNRTRVGLGDLNFRRVLNQENPLFLGYESAEDIQCRGFTRAGATTNQYVLTGKNEVFESIGVAGRVFRLRLGPGYKVARVELSHVRVTPEDCTAE